MVSTVGSKRVWLRRGIPALAVVLIAGGVFGTRAFASSGNTPSYRLGTVTKGSVDQTLTLSGTAQKASQSTASFKVSGTVRSVPVAIGDPVSAGQTVATLDPTALQQAVTTAEATLAQARATLENDESGTSSSAANVGYDSFTTTSSEVFAIDTALVHGPGSTSSTPKAPTPKTPAAAAKAVAQAQAAVASAQRAASAALAEVSAAAKAQAAACASALSPGPGSGPGSAPTATAPSTGAGSTPTLADCVKAVQAAITAEAAAATAQTALAQAQAALVTALASQAKALASSAGTGSGSGSGSGSPSQRAGAGTGSTSRNGSGSGSGSAQSSAQRVASDKTAVTTAQSALATAEQNLAHATLTAPISGTVAALSYTAGSPSSSGSITIVGAGAVDVTVDVPLASLPSVKVGQAASVTSAGSSTPMPGTVHSISLLPASSTSTSVSYPAVVRVPEPTTALASGSGASATITLATVKDVLTVPNSAITTLVAGTGVVRTVANGQVTRTLVRTGAVGSTTTQVLSGLKAGQRVVIANLSEALPTNTTPSRFGNRSGGSGLTSSLTGAGGGPRFVTGGGGFGGGGLTAGPGG